jgi:hypothetical protein
MKNEIMEREQMKVLFTLLVMVGILSLTLSLKPLIVGYTIMDVREERSVEDDRKPVLEKITHLKAYVGEEFRYLVRATDEDDEQLVFSDDSELFNISKDGLISFIPTGEMIGTHYTAIIVKDRFGKGDVKIVSLVIRHRE